ncbi:sugar phosphate nucleotidyltransferase [Aquimarina sp. 2201CG5-10]|uniref:sugar phosphate nucleotidyltransferase n=1 Tax=Aquimarina callyspongiae TaxID=3098150 RepID=UPI002AB51600|nr:sugar phosphate nucleotidyltransferase [Aquimarina sp. 2201CG5-10]MDY8138843.1 sugar phosphate nucleotidyltransferase [Aquimarina sp. 2201CG5-10]
MGHNSLVILAGGASSRMKKEVKTSLDKDLSDQANTRTKSLIGIDGSGRPLMDYLLYNAKQAGYKNIYIVIGEKEELMQTFYGNKNKGNDFYGLTINYAIQYIPENRVKPFGTADAVQQAVTQYPELAIESYTVCNSDNLYSIEALKALRAIGHPNAFISYDRDALRFSEERISRFALVSIDKEGFLKSIIEKPSLENVDMYKDDSDKLRVSMNIFKFDGKEFNYYLENCPVNKERNEKEIPSALLNMTKDHPVSVKAIPMSEHVPDLTSKEDILIMKEHIKTNYQTMDWNA